MPEKPQDNAATAPPRKPSYRSVLAKVAARRAVDISAPAPDVESVAEPPKDGNGKAGLRTPEERAAEIIKRIDETVLKYDEYLKQGVIVPTPRDVALFMQEKQKMEEALAKKEEVEDVSVYYDIGRQVAEQGGAMKELIAAVRAHLAVATKRQAAKKA